MNELKLHLGLIQRIVFVLLKNVRVIQNIISQIYWLLIVRPLLWCVWKINGHHQYEGIRRITFYKNKPFSKLYGIFLRCILTINGWLSGLKNSYKAYEVLLKWNPNIPLIALRSKAITYEVSTLGDENPQKKGWYTVLDNLILSTSQVAGHFMIIEKTIGDNEANKKVTIKCVWIKGRSVGRIFTIGYQGLRDRNNQDIPDYIYFPPRTIVLLFEVLFAVSALTALVVFLFQCWDIIKSFHLLELIKRFFISDIGPVLQNFSLALH